MDSEGEKSTSSLGTPTETKPRRQEVKAGIIQQLPFLAVNGLGACWHRNVRGGGSLLMQPPGTVCWGMFALADFYQQDIDAFKYEPRKTFGHQPLRACSHHEWENASQRLTWVALSQIRSFL
jgi:hypothetical protein